MIVVDASFALNLVLNEPSSVAVRAQWQGWDENGELIIAPALFRAETLSVVRRNVRRGVLADAAGERAFADLDRAPRTRHPERQRKMLVSRDASPAGSA